MVDYDLLPIYLVERTDVGGGSVSLIVARSLSGNEVCFACLLIDLWKIGLKDGFGRMSMTKDEFDVVLEAMVRDAEAHGIHYHPIDISEAKWLVAQGLRIAEKVGTKPVNKKWVDMVGDISSVKIGGSLYKCYRCEKGELQPEDDELILKVAKSEMETAGLLGETMMEFLCEECMKKKSLRGRRKNGQAKEKKKAKGEPASRFSRELLEKGYRLYADKRYGEAAELFVRVLDADPWDTDAMVALAGCLMYMGHFTQAARILKHAAEVHPDDPLIRYNLGYALACMGRLSEARRELRRCLKPGSPQDIKQQAEMLTSALNKLKSDEGIPFEKEVMCHNLFLEAQRLLVNQQYKEAIQVYMQILKIKPNHAASFANIGLCYERIGNLEKALEYFRRAHELDESDPLTLLNMSHIFHRQGCDRKAEEYMRKGLKQVSPVTPPRDIYRIATILVEMGKLGEGEQFLKDQLRKRSGDIQLTFFLGVAMAKQGKLSEAQQVWRQIKDECKEARKYMEAAEKVLKGEKTLEEADFRMLIVAKTMEVL
jgi:tetratricopeptide (TPR) repeat protein